MRRLCLCLLVALAVPAEARDPIRPAELPPPDYAGLQYVDSKGCMFVRAGAAAEVLWVPRVSRNGTPDCDNPPSGRRVPVAEEVGVTPFSPEAQGTAAAAATPEAKGLPDVSAPGGYFVAVGSFASAGNADRAEAKLQDLGYGSVRGSSAKGDQTLTTVYAGPLPDLAAAEAAEQALRGAGFPDAEVAGL